MSRASKISCRKAFGEGLMNAGSDWLTSPAYFERHRRHNRTEARR
jgi:hypothetical protein